MKSIQYENRIPATTTHFSQLLTSLLTSFSHMPPNVLPILLTKMTCHVRHLTFFIYEAGMKETKLTSSCAHMTIRHYSCVSRWHSWAIHQTCTYIKSALVNQGLKFGKGKKRELGSCYSREIQLNQPSSHYRNRCHECGRCQNCVLYFVTQKAKGYKITTT